MSAVAPSGEQVEIRRGAQRLVVVTGGGGMRTYSVGGQELLDGFDEDEVVTAGRGQLLIPWPNRIGGGRYSFDGSDYQVALTEPEQNNAIHGFTRGHTWTVAAHGDGRAALDHIMVAQTGYPWALRLRVEYLLDSRGVTVRVSATNLGSTPAPLGTGAHPYLRPGPGRVDDWTLRVPASTHLLTDDRQIPVGTAPVAGTPFDFREPHLIGPTVLDTAFTTVLPDPDGLTRVVVADPATGVTLALWMDSTHPYFMVFTGDTVGARARQGLGVEPMTCPPNAFASGTDLGVLQPGETTVSSWGITPTGLDLGN